MVTYFVLLPCPQPLLDLAHMRPQLLLLQQHSFRDSATFTLV